MAARKARNAGAPPAVEPELIANALAKAVYDGDIVNLKMLFLPFAPTRGSETEKFDSAKYGYLLPGAEEAASIGFREVLHLVREPDIWRHIEQELHAERPTRLPSALVMKLADRAVSLGKYTAAAQAYEMLRIRSRMQDAFLEQADACLEKNDVARGVKGYVVATGLEYDYAAFPEPLPLVPDYQRRALMLHAVYPERPEDSIPMQELETFLRTALGFLLLSAEAAARLDQRPLEQRMAFLNTLIRMRDPQWDVFVQQFQESCRRMEALREALAQTSASGGYARLSSDDALGVSAALLGRSVHPGEWWQYLKELAYEHPAAVLFVSRQIAGDTEVLVPRLRADNPMPVMLGLATR